MLWTIRVAVCLVAVGSNSQLCGGTRLEEFLQEKQSYLEEFDSLFDALYFNTTRPVSADTNAQRQVDRSEPLPSPDWPTHSILFDDVTGEGEDSDDYLDTSQATLFEEENYRPREEASGRDVRVKDSHSEEENVFSGDSGMFLTEKPGDDEEEEDEDVGSGDDSTTETSTIRQSTAIVQDSTTSVPVEPNNAFNLECKDRLRGEITSCIEFSWNVRALFQETESYVAQSGYYNVSSGQYLYQLFRTCASTIASPASCLRVLGSGASVMDAVHNIATRTTIAFASRRHEAASGADQSYLDCFQTHLQFLRACVGAHVSAARLETLARAVVARVRDASGAECGDLDEVRRCAVGATTRCEDAISVQLVGDMFRAAKEGMGTCSADYEATAAATLSSGSVFTLVLSVLALGLRTQMN